MVIGRRLRERITTRRGLSLLEVILALTILGVSAAFLAQAMQLASKNALRAQNLAQAELVAESVMNQVVAGVLPAQATAWTPFFSSATTASTSDSDWVYLVAIVPAEIEGMMGIQVGVRDSSKQSLTEQSDYTATRWIIDPSLALDTPPDTTSTESTSTGSATGSGTSTTGATTGR